MCECSWKIESFWPIIIFIYALNFVTRTWKQEENFQFTRFEQAISGVGPRARERARHGFSGWMIRIEILYTSGSDSCAHTTKGWKSNNNNNKWNKLAANQNIFESNNYLMGDPDLIFKAGKKGENALKSLPPRTNQCWLER